MAKNFVRKQMFKRKRVGGWGKSHIDQPLKRHLCDTAKMFVKESLLFHVEFKLPSWIHIQNKIFTELIINILLNQVAWIHNS